MNKLTTLLLLITLALGGCTLPIASPTPASLPERIQPSARPSQSPVAETLSTVTGLAITPQNAVQVVELRRWGEGRPLHVAWSPGGYLLAVGTTLGISLYGSDTFQWVNAIELDSYPGAMAISPDGESLAVGLADGRVQIYQPFDGKLYNNLEGHLDVVDSLAFSPDGKLLAFTSEDDTVRGWSLPDGNLLFANDQMVSLNALVFSADSKTLFVGGEGLQFWDSYTFLSVLTLINTGVFYKQAAMKLSTVSVYSFSFLTGRLLSERD